MPKMNAPIHSYENPQIYYQSPKIWFLGNLFLGNDAPYGHFDLISVPALTFNNIFSFHLLNSNSIFFNICQRYNLSAENCLEICLIIFLIIFL